MNEWVVTIALEVLRFTRDEVGDGAGELKADESLVIPPPFVDIDFFSLFLGNFIFDLDGVGNSCFVSHFVFGHPIPST